jgi:hypothetical protein
MTRNRRVLSRSEQFSQAGRPNLPMLRFPQLFLTAVLLLGAVSCKSTPQSQSTLLRKPAAAAPSASPAPASSRPPHSKTSAPSKSPAQVAATPELPKTKPGQPKNTAKPVLEEPPKGLAPAIASNEAATNSEHSDSEAAKAASPKTLDEAASRSARIAPPARPSGQPQGLEFNTNAPWFGMP